MDIDKPEVMCGVTTFAQMAKPWSGEGPPPVGTVCDVLNGALSSPEWERCTILYSGKHRVMYDSESCSERVGFIEELKFRQIRTPEQIAAEEREAAVKAMILLNPDENPNVSLAKWLCETLYDAGYRKFEIVEDE